MVSPARHNPPTVGTRVHLPSHEHAVCGETGMDDQTTATPSERGSTGMTKNGSKLLKHLCKIVGFPEVGGGKVTGECPLAEVGTP